MWANGQNVKDDGTGGKQGAGVHPFLLVESATKGEYVGLFMRNTNAMSPVIKYKGDSKSVVSLITSGGNIELIIIMKGSAKQVIKQYHQIIGLPSLPPMWSMGFGVVVNNLN